MNQERRRAMRGEKVVLVLGATLLVGLLVMFVGCGSDDKSTNSADYDDPEFLVVQQEIGHFIDSTLEYFTNGLGNIYGIATDTTVDPVQYGSRPPEYDSTKDTAVATYAEGWHVVYFSIHRDTYNKIVRDSIQFIKDGQPQQSSAGLESLYYKHFWTHEVTDTTVTHRSYTGNADYAFVGLDTTQVTITGTNEWQVHSKYASTDSTVWRDINVDATLTDMKVNKTGSGWVQGCPSAGSISASIEMVYKKDSAAPDTTDWTVSLTFNNGSMFSTVTIGSAPPWTYSTQLCTPPY
jgi:hypothetical protein